MPMTLIRDPDDMRPFPAFHYMIKVMALVTVIIGAIWTTDYYWPEKTEVHEITNSGYYAVGKGITKQASYFVISEGDTIDIPQRAFNLANPGRDLVMHYTGLFGEFKGLEIHSRSGLEGRAGPENRYTLNSFFPKLLLTSLFALLFLRPKYWMSALAWINSVVALVFSGMPMLTMVLLVMLVAFIAFAVMMYLEYGKKRVS